MLVKRNELTIQYLHLLQPLSDLIVLPWWIRRYILRKKGEVCPELYKFEDEAWTESDGDSGKGEKVVGEAKGVSSGVETGHQHQESV